jgi:hypothetical protein
MDEVSRRILKPIQIYRFNMQLRSLAAILALSISGLCPGAVLARPAHAEPAPDSLLFPFLDVPDLTLPVSAGTRRCCLLGTNFKMFGIFPGKQTWDPSSLGFHVYGGGNGEFNGNIATCHAGIIDTAHVRYAADLVLRYALLIEQLGPEGGRIPLHPEAGRGGIQVAALPEGRSFDEDYVIETAGSITIDLTSWHEIATWYDFSEMPLYSEKGSSFSPEDAYSNQLGVTLGKAALRVSNRRAIVFGEAVTQLLKAYLLGAGALPESESIRILDALELDSDFDSATAGPPWFDPRYQIPDYRRLIKRQTALYGEVQPTRPPPGLLPPVCKAPARNRPNYDPWALNQPQLWDRYRIEIQLKRSTKMGRLLKRSRPLISQQDFPAMIRQIESEISREWESPWL